MQRIEYVGEMGNFIEKGFDVSMKRNDF